MIALALFAALAAPPAPPAPPTSPWLEWFMCTGSTLGASGLGLIAGLNIGQDAGGDPHLGVLIAMPVAAVGGAVLGSAVLREEHGQAWSMGGAFLGAGLAGGASLGLGLALRDEHPNAAAIGTLITSLVLTPLGALWGAGW